MIDSIDHMTLKIAFLAYKCLGFAINMQCCYGLYYVRLLNMGLDTRKSVFRFVNNKGADQPAHPPQTDQRLCYSLAENNDIQTCHKRNFNFLASLCS